MVGSSIFRSLLKMGYNRSHLLVKTRKELDLSDQIQVEEYISAAQPNKIIMCAARVGGIQANSKYPVEFLMQNMMIQNNIISASLKSNVTDICFLGSSCMYPVGLDRPIKEDDLFSGPFEKTNEAYALAKSTGLKLCHYVRTQYGINAFTVVPNNSYGPGDNYDNSANHVIPATINKIKNAMDNHINHIDCWGTGSPLRDFLYIDDLANAVIWLLQNISSDSEYDVFNVGTGKETSIKDLVEMISNKLGFDGTINWDTNKPDGMKRKLLDITRIKNYGWYPKVSLEEGLDYTIHDLKQKIN